MKFKRPAQQLQSSNLGRLWRRIEGGAQGSTISSWQRSTHVTIDTRLHMQCTMSEIYNNKTFEIDTVHPEASELVIMMLLCTLHPFHSLSKIKNSVSINA